MTTFYFVRHAAHGLPPGTLPGRTPGVGLSPEGEAQAARLSERFAAVPLDAVVSGPLERAQLTAHAVAAGRDHLLQEVSNALDELHYGDWTGRTVEDLDAHDPRWRPYNHARSLHRAPCGEGMLDVQARVLHEIGRLRQRFPEGHVAVVSHADPIRGALAYLLGMPLDLFLRLRIDPASVSAARVGDWGPEILCVNDCGGAPLPV
jgi:probable phosphoglycerate mutase